MKTDAQIQKDVMDELKWQPFLNSSEIGVAVKNGIVTLSGIVDTYSKKLTAEKVAKKVAGVKAVAEEIQVGLSPAYRKTDAEIAEAVYDTLKWHTAIREDEIKIKVENGVVFLDGQVEWAYERNYAKTAIENLAGVKSIINQLTVKPRINPFELENKITAAFQRSATLDSSKISTSVIGNKVILRGTVRSFAEIEDAENAVWAAPGVMSIENHLVLEEPEYAY